MIADTAFCTDVGQVKTGLGKADTYLGMLEEINRVTPSVANGVASQYPDVQALVNAFRLHGENALEDLPVSSYSYFIFTRMILIRVDLTEHRHKRRVTNEPEYWRCLQQEDSWNFYGDRSIRHRCLIDPLISKGIELKRRTSILSFRVIPFEDGVLASFRE